MPPGRCQTVVSRPDQLAPPPPAASWRIGTIGFSYPDWSGPFYPEYLKQADWLEYYSRHYDTVELDTTFYAIPPIERVERWAAAVPANFRFCPKTPRTITHEGLLATKADEMRRFVEACRAFGPKLGAVLIQFPPSVTAERFADVDAFLGSLPADARFAVEFRHRSWGTADALHLLHDRGCAFVSAEYATRPARVFATADFLYLRLIGVHDTYPKHERELADPSDRLAWWREAAGRVAEKVTGGFVFANNDYAGYAPATANRVKHLFGQVVKEPTEGKTGELFG